MKSGGTITSVVNAASEPGKKTVSSGTSKPAITAVKPADVKARPQTAVLPSTTKPAEEKKAAVT
jgi:hypothetical protein